MRPKQVVDVTVAVEVEWERKIKTNGTEQGSGTITVVDVFEMGVVSTDWGFVVS
jgi:hypothetical protein